MKTTSLNRLMLTLLERLMKSQHIDTCKLEIPFKLTLFFLFASQLIAYPVFAESTPTERTYRAEIHAAVNLIGKVVDAESGEPLFGSTVMIENSSKGASTDDDGEFEISNLDDGTYNLIVRYLGYQEQVVTVTITNGQYDELTIQLSPDSLTGEDVVVYAQAIGQARAILEQLNSNTIVNVVSETRLRELPDANAAESIGRLPGISVLRDAGEGQKVAIRGMAPRYSSITIDGNKVPGTSGDRSVDLSMISPEMLSGIEVYKSLRPDMDADAIGGSVNFKMGGARNERMYRFNVESGYSSQISDVGNYKASLMASDRFFNRKLGVLVSANAQQVDRSAHIFAAGYTILRDARPGEPHAPVEISNMNIQDSQGIRERLGGGINLDWRLKNSKIFFNNSYNEQNRDEIVFERRYNITSNNQEWRPRHRLTDISTINSTLSGEHDYSWIQAEWRFNRSATTNNTPYNHSARFFEPSALKQQGADFSGSPEWIPYYVLNRIDLAYLESLSNNESEQFQENRSASLDVKIPVRIRNFLDGFIKFGGKHYHNYRDRLTTRYSIAYWQVPTLINSDIGTFPWQVNGSGGAMMNPFIPDLTNSSYWILNHTYEMAYMPSINNVDQIWDEYSELYNTQYQARLDDYKATERLSAGYLMSELNIGKRLMILPGVRYEYEHSDYTAKAGQFQDKLENLDEEDLNQSYSDTVANRDMGMWFPMFQLRYRATDWFDVRMARTVSTSRPSFGNVSPRFNINYDGKSVIRGNTQIRPMKSTNYDLFLTFNHNNFGLFTVGGFYKEVEDLIYTRNANIVFPLEMGLPANTRLFRISEPVNNENLTTVKGFEIEWQSNFTNAIPPFNGLVINANLSRFYSEANYHSFEFRRSPQGIIGVDTFRVAPMIHQADLIANISVGYDIGNFSSRISMQYQGKTLIGIGDRPEKDQYSDAYQRFDASFRYRLSQGRVILFADVANITNREDRSSQFTYDRPRAIEYYGIAFDTGVEIRF